MSWAIGIIGALVAIGYLVAVATRRLREVEATRSRYARHRAAAVVRAAMGPRAAQPVEASRGR